MELNEFKKLINDPDQLATALLNEHCSHYSHEVYQKYADVKHHDVFNPQHRPDKRVKNEYEDEEGNKITGDKLVKVNRIGYPLQKHIVNLSSVFTAGGGVTLSPVKGFAEGSQEEMLYNQLLDTWRSNKLDFKNVKIAEITMSQTECAEVWYTDPETKQLKCRLYQPKDGYKLIPIMDGKDDMIAYAITYTHIDRNSTSGSGTKEHMLVWTSENQYSFIKDASTRDRWAIDKDPEGNDLQTVKLPYGKIPVMHFHVHKVEWADVDSMISRLETQTSNFSDNNDYNSSPILFAKGQILNQAEKGDAGKLIEGDEKTELQYVGWQHAPEAVKQEHEILKENIYTLSQTPNLSPEILKGLGDISGPAFDRMMMNAHLKALKYQVDWFGETIQRRVNFLIAAIPKVYPAIAKGTKIDVVAKFELFQIKDTYRLAQTLALATGNKPYVTQEQAAALMGLSDDPKATIEQVRKETDASAAPNAVDFNTIQQAGAKGQPAIAT